MRMLFYFSLSLIRHRLSSVSLTQGMKLLIHSCAYRAKKLSNTYCFHQVKCDKTVPACHNCGRLRVQCPGYEEHNRQSSADVLSSVESVYRTSGVEKRRVGSCEECRRAKRRCCRSRPQCRQCSRRSQTCTYISGSSQQMQLERPISSPSAGPESGHSMLERSSIPCQTATTTYGFDGVQWYGTTLPPYLMVCGN